MSTPRDESNSTVHSTEQSRRIGRPYEGDEDALDPRLRPGERAVFPSVTTPRETPFPLTEDDGSDGDNSAPEATRAAPVFPPFNVATGRYREPRLRLLDDPNARPQWNILSPPAMARRLQGPTERTRLPSVSEVIRRVAFRGERFRREDDGTGSRDRTERSAIQADSVEESMEVDSQHTAQRSPRPTAIYSLSTDNRHVRTSPFPLPPPQSNIGAAVPPDSRRGRASTMTPGNGSHPPQPSAAIPQPPRASVTSPTSGDSPRRRSTGMIVQPTPFNFPPPPQPQPAQPPVASPLEEKEAGPLVPQEQKYKSARAQELAELKALGIERVDDPTHIYRCPKCKDQSYHRFKPATNWERFLQHYSRCGQVQCHFCGKSYTAKARPHHMHRHIVGHTGMKPCPGLQNLIKQGVDTYGRLRDWMMKNDKDMDNKYIGAPLGGLVRSSYGKDYDEPINFDEYRIKEPPRKRPPRQKTGGAGKATTKANATTRAKAPTRAKATTRAKAPPAATSAIPPAQSNIDPEAPAPNKEERPLDGWAALVEATVAQHDALTGGQHAPNNRAHRAVSFTPSPPPPTPPIQRGRSRERQRPRAEQGPIRRRSASPRRRSPSIHSSISAASVATSPTQSNNTYDEEGESEVDEDARPEHDD